MHVFCVCMCDVCMGVLHMCVLSSYEDLTHSNPWLHVCLQVTAITKKAAPNSTR